MGASAPLVRKGDTAAFAAVAKKRISVLHGSGGGGKSPTRNRHSAPTPGSSGAPISEAAAEYKRFHALATSRKLALALCSIIFSTTGWSAHAFVARTSSLARMPHRSAPSAATTRAKVTVTSVANRSPRGGETSAGTDRTTATPARGS